MNSSDLHGWQKYQIQWQQEAAAACAVFNDPSHDMAHVERVVKCARELALAEGARMEVVVPAAYLHDVEPILKTDTRRSQASRLSAVKALNILRAQGYPEEHFEAIAHAIEAHSFSAAIEATSLEAQIVQDADRLDGLGAIGIARCFGFSGLIQRDFYSLSDPFCETRIADDSQNSLDHFFIKLLKVPAQLRTRAAREEGARRREFMESFLLQLRREIVS